MKLFDSELHHLSELYERLEHEMARAGTVESNDSTDALIGIILENRELFCRIDQMNTRVYQLIGEWQDFRERLAPDDRERTQQLAATLARRANNLGTLLAQRCALVEKKRARLASELSVLSRGSKYLQSVKPIKVNYPKFIDSVC
jgi:hypothetical protein